METGGIEHLPVRRELQLADAAWMVPCRCQRLAGRHFPNRHDMAIVSPGAEDAVVIASDAVDRRPRRDAALDQLAGNPFGAQGRSDFERLYPLRKSIG